MAKVVVGSVVELGIPLVAKLKEKLIAVDAAERREGEREGEVGGWVCVWMGERSRFN